VAIFPSGAPVEKEKGVAGACETSRSEASAAAVDLASAEAAVDVSFCVLFGLFIILDCYYFCPPDWGDELPTLTTSVIGYSIAPNKSDLHLRG
jgi:hypothetical protein